MEIEEKLNELKKDYLLIKPREDLVGRGFWQIREKLSESKPKRFLFVPVFGRGLVFLSIIVIFLLGFGTVQASQKALPGEILYPIKILSENISLSIQGDGQKKVERRAEEVIQTIEEKNGPESLKRATDEYKKTLKNTKEKIERSGENDEFEKDLMEQEAEFEKVRQEHESASDELRGVIEAARESRDDDDGEVEGINDQEDGENEEDSKGDGNEKQKKSNESEDSSGSNKD